MSLDNRIQRLMPVLSAKERGILVLRSLKSGKAEDPFWRQSMPSGQARDFNRYIGLMNAANIQLSALITVTEQMVFQTEQRLAWLHALCLWFWHTMDVVDEMRDALKEPITKSAYAELQESVGNEFEPVSALADLLTGEHDFADSEREVVEGGKERFVKEDAWSEIQQKKEEELRQLVKDRKLIGRGRGEDMEIQKRSFYAWLRRPLPIPSTSGLAFDVVPDRDAEQAASTAEKLRRLCEAVSRSPFDGHKELGNGNVGDGLPCVIEILRDTTIQRLQHQWQEIIATETVLERIAEEFDGEDPLKPKTREGLEQSKALVLEIKDELDRLGQEVELPQPDQATLNLVFELANRMQRLFDAT